MDDIRRIATPILIASPAGHRPPADDRLRRGGQTPSVWEVAAALNDPTLRDMGVPVIARREAQRDDPKQRAVYFCAPDFIARCIVLDDAYELTRLYPPDHLYRLPNWRAIRLVPAEWLVEERDAVHQYEGRTTWTTASWEAIDAAVLERVRRLAWLETTRPLTAAEDSYLEHVDRMIDFTRDIEMDRRADKVEIRYERKRATAVARTLRDVYSFDLVGVDESPFAKGDLVTVDVGEPGAHGGWEAGRVIRAEGRRITIMFDRKFSESVIADTGTIRTGGGDKQYRLQHRAVDALRRGESRNSHLLAALVERAFPRDHAPPSPNPAGKGGVSGIVRRLLSLLRVRRATDQDAGPLEPSQNRVLRRAADVNDVFLTMGPPGTGKTTTIVQMTRDRIGLREKVLVTSRNHKAVDNVLVKFVGRADILVIRLGHEENIEDSVKELLIDRKAQEIQGRIMDDILSSFGSLRERVGPWCDVDDILVFLRESGATWTELGRERADALARIERVQATIADAWLPALRARAAEIDQQRRRAARCRALVNAATRAWLAASRWRSWPVAAALSIAAHDWMESRRRRDEEDADMYRSGAATYEREMSAYRDEVTGAPDVLEAKAEARRASAELETFVGTVRAKVATLTEDPHVPLPTPVPDLAGPADLEAYLRAVTAALPVSWEEMWRYHLHKRWLEVLEERRLALYPALIGAADVVGATCVGIAADARFDDLAFDTVIADECGQILVSDLLVPLVRGRRAVLFGDHMQLPPFIEAQVVERMREVWQKRGASEDERQSLALVEKSIFEILYEDPRTPGDDRFAANDARPSPRKMMLDTQYRMPACIADLISAHFYGGNYRTSPKLLRARDESWLLGGAFCFVDTMHREEFRERKVTLRGEDGEERVCDNYGEAEVLARLAGTYLEALALRGDAEPERGLGIIVPYKSQVERVRVALAARGLPEGIVATVDSFQGNERDVILFGFTRSNEPRDGGREIGFLRELRRLNVILTRAREQLVLVGDSDTLVKGDDAAFAGFCAALIEHVKGLEAGGLGRYLDVDDLPGTIDATEGMPWPVLRGYLVTALDANFDFDPHRGRWGRDAGRHRHVARPKNASPVVSWKGRGR